MSKRPKPLILLRKAGRISHGPRQQSIFHASAIVPLSPQLQILTYSWRARQALAVVQRMGDAWESQ